jgi:DNA-binding NarL/FixJ family response regulator
VDVQTDTVLTPFPVSQSIAIVSGDEVRARRVLAALPHVSAPLRASTVEELLAACAAAQAPRIVAVAENGADVTRTVIKELHDALPGARIVAVIGEPRGVRRILKAGADGVVLESELEAALEVTIQAVNAGQIVVARELRANVERDALSFRERQILGLVVLGFTNGEIAGQLCLAESTIKSHLSTAFGKLGVRSRKEAVALILDPDEGLGTGILAISGHEQALARGSAA